MGRIEEKEEGKGGIKMVGKVGLRKGGGERKGRISVVGKN